MWVRLSGCLYIVQKLSRPDDNSRSTTEPIQDMGRYIIQSEAL